jgi:hypothetical protein
MIGGCMPLIETCLTHAWAHDESLRKPVLLLTFLNMFSIASLTETHLPTCWLVSFSELFHTHGYNDHQFLIDIQNKSKLIAPIDKCVNDSED